MSLFRKVILIAVLTMSCFASTSLFAQAEFVRSPYEDDQGDYNMQSVCRKLGRGVANVAFGALELPITIFKVNSDENAIAAYTYGVFLGVARCLTREVVGAVEIVTFPIPLPGCKPYPYETGAGMGPILKPEWVIDLSTDPYNTFYSKTPIIR